MENITAKTNYDGVATPPPATAVHPSAQYNDRRKELQGAVTDSGQALDAADGTQLSKASFANAVGAQSMKDGGGVNTIVLTPVTGASGLRVATPVARDYSLLDGAIFNFAANNTNSGNMTVNVGQTGGVLIGAVPLFLEDGSTQVPAGIVVGGTYYSVRFDAALSGGSGAFVLISGAIPNGWRHSGGVAHNAASPTSWTTLDLSSIIGVNYAFVVLKIKSSSQTTFKFKPDGDADVYNAAPISGSNMVDLAPATNQVGLVSLETSALGRVEWIAGNTDVATITVLGFMRQLM